MDTRELIINFASVLLSLEFMDMAIILPEGHFTRNPYWLSFKRLLSYIVPIRTEHSGLLANRGIRSVWILGLDIGHLINEMQNKMFH